jgi:hypothetical protein
MYIWLFVIYSYINDDNAGVLQNILEEVTTHKTSESGKWIIQIKVDLENLICFLSVANASH